MSKRMDDLAMMTGLLAFLASYSAIRFFLSSSAAADSSSSSSPKSSKSSSSFFDSAAASAGAFSSAPAPALANGKLFKAFLAPGNELRPAPKEAMCLYQRAAWTCFASGAVLTASKTTASEADFENLPNIYFNCII